MTESVSKDSEIRTLLPKGELAYPLSQHMEAPANPIVKRRSCLKDRRLRKQEVLCHHRSMLLYPEL